jgi:hypothetical protein
MGDIGLNWVTLIILLDASLLGDDGSFFLMKNNFW